MELFSGKRKRERRIWLSYLLIDFSMIDDVIAERALSKDIMGNLENVERMQSAYSMNIRYCRDNIQLLNIIPLLLLGEVLRYTDECCNHFR